MGKANREGNPFGAGHRCFRSRSVVVLPMKNAPHRSCTDGKLAEFPVEIAHEVERRVHRAYFQLAGCHFSGDRIPFAEVADARLPTTGGSG